MNDKKRKALESAGYRVGDAADFLGLTDEERALVDLRAAVSRAVHVQRKKRNLTQVKLAELLNSSQSRVAKIEAGSNDVSLDLMFRGLFAMGGNAGDVLKMKSAFRTTSTAKRSGNRRTVRASIKAKRHSVPSAG